MQATPRKTNFYGNSKQVIPFAYCTASASSGAYMYVPRDETRKMDLDLSVISIMEVSRERIEDIYF